MEDFSLELKAALKAAKIAEKKILEVYGTSFDIEIKSDDSPVTEADKKADAIIRETLFKEFPDYGFLTEESVDTGERLNKRIIWIIDPVDGTKEFVSRNGQFTTNIALAKDGEVVLGIINVPTMGLTYYAVKGQGAYCIEGNNTPRKIHVSDKDKGLRAMRSISFFQKKEEEFFSSHKEAFKGEPEMVGAALKFCLLAEGKYDFFYRSSGNTKEWDIAAGDIILSEAGGIMVEPNGKPFTYNRKDVYNRNGYIMANKKGNLFI